MEKSFVTSVILPLCLVAIMFGMGLSLVKKDFKKVFASLRPTLTGLFCQLFMLPCLAFFLANFFKLKPTMAVGLMILGLVPGAVTSNFFTYLAKGNVALSVSLTAIVSLVAPFSLPILLSFSMSYFFSSQQELNLPLAKMSLSLFSITLFPVILGMLVRDKYEAFALRAEEKLRFISTGFLLFIVFVLIRQNWAIIPESFGAIGLVCLLFNLLTLLFGFVISKLSGLSKRDAITIAIESGFQSSATAIFIAGTLLNRGDIAIVPAVYSLVMLLTGGGLVWALKRSKTLHTLPSESSESCQV